VHHKQVIQIESYKCLHKIKLEIEL